MHFSAMIFAGLLIVLIIDQIDTTAIPSQKKSSSSTKTVCVIGAGASGLASAKYSLEQGFDVTVYEQTKQIGGIWYYTDETGVDQYSVPIHTPMYQGLRTQGPYYTTQYPDFRYPENKTWGDSLTSADVLGYLQSYANHFNLMEHIKLSHVVTRVIPIENDRWKVHVRNARTNSSETHIYDIVFVCNGQNSLPFKPTLNGADEFKGEMIHSHDYRKPDPYKNKTVLVIGNGASGLDLKKHISKVANQVTLSIRRYQPYYSDYMKGEVMRFTATGAEFKDGTNQTFDAVIFATGYRPSLPFLDSTSGISIDYRTVKPLFKDTVSIEHPTMAFIGIKERSSMPIFDCQIKLALKFILSQKQFATKDGLFKSVDDDGSNDGNMVFLYCTIWGDRKRCFDARIRQMCHEL